ncbi:hypothetical protein CU098_005561 [Rhizopus stolonifer]|uniref:Uncharacterized protein n=1 Tax=Rhizopus stolonifer TaxID=4846 RepID=A0A367J9F8_RHIST|nr:hypothetical protein CU098_005561 [Rhizopus stolonifer]
MAGWRKALLETGRIGDLYHCQLCKHRFWVKQRTVCATLFHYKVFRIVLTAMILGLLLLPAGNIMKILIHFSVLLSNHPGGLTQAWTSNSFFDVLLKSGQTAIMATFSQSSTSDASSHVLFSPFPVCSANGLSDSHSLLSNWLLYYFLFPFSDDRFWELILCRLEHFHLGFFLLGSICNIVFTCKLLNDMFDIVLLPQDEDEDEEDASFNVFFARLCKITKGFLLTHCCSLIVFFWIYFNIFAFHIDSNSEHMFVAKLPLWILRWVTLGLTVAEFAKNVYHGLSKIMYGVDQEDVLSLPEQS